MSFSLRNLSVLAYANGFTLWYYKYGAQPLGQVTECGFFRDAADLLANGDAMILSGADGVQFVGVSGEGRRISVGEQANKLRPFTIDAGGNHIALPAPAAAPSDAYILTASGGRFEYDNPDGSTYTIEDIAFALAGIARFTGHAARPHGFIYSVAQHCVLAVNYLLRHHPLIGPETLLATLLHDASEAFMADIASPLKRLLPDYNALEKRVQGSIYRRFGICMTDEVHAAITSADLVMLATEKRELMPHDPQPWPILDGVLALGGPIVPWPAPVAERFFMRTFTALHAACNQPVAAAA